MPVNGLVLDGTFIKSVLPSKSSAFPEVVAPVNTTLPPLQKVVAPPAVIVGVVGNTFTVILVGLLVPVIAGVLLTTLMRYPKPCAVDEGMAAVIVPAAVLLRVPIFTGLVNAPALLLSCAVNTLPEV